MKQTKIKVCVEGTSPLLMNRFRDKSIDKKCQS